MVSKHECYKTVIMVWAWMLRLSHAFETRTLVRFWRYCVLGMDALVSVWSQNTHVIKTVIMVWAWMLWLSYAHGRDSDLGMDALVSVWSRNTNVIKPLLWFGHGCSGYRMLSKHER